MHDVQYYKSIFDKYGGMMRTTQLAEEKIFYPQREKLIDKIAALGGSHRADILKDNMVCFNTRKHSNEAIYYNVNYLEDAIQ